MDEKELQKIMDGIAQKNGDAIKTAVETAVKEAAKNLLTPEGLATKLDSLGLKADVIKTLNDAIEKQGIEIKKLLEGGSNAKYKDLGEFIEKNKDEIAKAENGRIKLKVDKTLVQSTAVTDSTRAMRLADIGQIAHRSTSVLEIIRRLGRVVTLTEAEVAESSGVIRYIDQNAITRSAAPVAEGAAKPESAIDWIEKTLAMQYLADTIPVTRQAWRRLGFVRGEVERLLNINLQLIIDEQLRSGDGLAPNLKGLLTSAAALNEANLVTQTGQVQSANIYDFIAALKVYITNGPTGTGKQSKYMPQAVMVPPGLALQAKRTKYADSHYATPNFVSPDGRFVDGIEIIEVPGMTANTMLLGDFRYVTVYEEEGYTLEMGLVNDDFKKNKFTLRAEQALAQLVRTVDEDAFVEVTDVAAGIAAITTP